MRDSVVERDLTLEWYMIHNLVVEVEAVDDATVQTEEVEGSVFDFDTPSTRKGNPNEARTEVL